MSARTIPPDKFLLYELAVTNAQPLARFFDGLVDDPRPRAPLLLAEDFSGAAALARAWCALSPRHHALAIDRDARVLARCPNTPRLATIARDARSPAHRDSPRAHIIAATNFPIGYWHSRRDLLTYLRAARSRLRPKGLLACDVYGGSDAMTPSTTRVRVRVPPEHRARLGCSSFIYEWRQVSGDRATNLVHNAIDFASIAGARPSWRIRGAFAYHWRLWSIPELRDAMLEAGFARVDVYDRLGHAIDQHGRVHATPLREGEPLDDPYVAYVIARRAPRT
jgi:hypothetical protein